MLCPRCAVWEGVDHSVLVEVVVATAAAAAEAEEEVARAP
jgi:hypothetical protein